MGAVGCNCCLKGFVFAANLIFFLIGAAMLAIGIWMLAKPEKFDEVVITEKEGIPNDILYLTNNHEYERRLETIKTVGIIGIVSGGVLMIAAALGCAGALTELTSLLGLNIFGLILLFFGVLFVVFFIFLFGEELTYINGYSFFRQKDIKTKIRSTMDEEIRIGKEDGLLNATAHMYDCCGIDATPDGRCPANIVPKLKCANSTTACRKGCYDPVVDSMAKMEFGVGIAVLVTGGALLIGMLLSCLLCCSVRRANRYAPED